MLKAVITRTTEEGDNAPIIQLNSMKQLLSQPSTESSRDSSHLLAELLRRAVLVFFFLNATAAGQEIRRDQTARENLVPGAPSRPAALEKERWTRQPVRCDSHPRSRESDGADLLTKWPHSTRRPEAARRARDGARKTRKTVAIAMVSRCIGARGKTARWFGQQGLLPVETARFRYDRRGIPPCREESENCE